MHHKPEECHLNPASTVNPQIANIMATDSLAPASDKNTKHTVQHQVNVAASDTNNSDLEDDE